MNHKILYISVIVFLALSSPLSADQRKIADYVSYGTVISQITLNSVHAFKSENRACEIRNELIGNGITILSSEIIKHLVHKERPDNSDNKSFWSEHSALAGANYSYNYAIGFSLTIGTMTGRIIAKKHYPIDVTVGAAVGIGINRLTNWRLSCFH